MKIKKWLIFIAGLLLVLGLACGSDDDDDSRFPTSRDSAEGLTDDNGTVQLDLGSHSVDVSITDDDSNPLSDITVNGFLLEEHLFVFASDTAGEYYPNFIFVPYSSMQSKGGGGFNPYTSGIQSPEAVQVIYVDVGLILYPVEQDFYAYDNEPPFNEEIYLDDWTTAHEAHGNLQDVYLLADSIALGGGVFIHITDDVASTTGADYQTAAVAMTQIEGYNEFSSLMGWVFHIYGADSLDMYYLTYDGIALPAIYIHNITVAQGDFWAQFTLTWGENPRDLDSHLWTPAIEDSTYHIAFYRKGDTLTAPYADLDWDDVTSWGPEHMTIHQAFPGIYTFAVHHWAGTSTIPNSGAQVTLVKPDRTTQVFTPPSTYAEAYWYWHVCTINGTTGEVTPIGIISASPPYPDESVNGMPEKKY